MNLKIDLVAPSHGIIWRENIGLIMDLYAKWANNYQEDQITLIYDTMWQSTRKMAEAIAEGIQQASPNTTIKLLNAVKNDKNDILVEVFKFKGYPCWITVQSTTVSHTLSLVF